MPVPTGLQAVTLTVGPLYDVGSNPIVGLPVKATLNAQVRITDSGSLLPSTVSTVTNSTGEASILLVASNSTGLDTTGFTYNIQVPGLTPSTGVDVLLLSENPSVRLEDLVPSSPSPGVVIWSPSEITDSQVAAAIGATDSDTRILLDTLYSNSPVDSVDGRTGAVTLGDLYDPAGAAAAVTAALNTHKTSDDHDGRYYTEAETNALLAGKAATTHAATHGRTGADPVPLSSLSSGAATAGHAPLADGGGGIVWGESAVANDPRFQSGKVRRIIVWDKVAQTWGSPAALPSWARANDWQSTNDPSAPVPPQAHWTEDDRWERADGAVWPLP